MSYYLKKKYETDELYNIFLIIDETANLYSKKNKNNYQNQETPIVMVKNDIDESDYLNEDNFDINNTELDIYKLDKRFKDNMAILPPCPNIFNNIETITESNKYSNNNRTYETLIINPLEDLNHKINHKILSAETKYVSKAKCEKNIRKLRNTRAIKLKKELLKKSKKLTNNSKSNKKEREEMNKLTNPNDLVNNYDNIRPKRRRVSYSHWNSSSFTK